MRARRVEDRSARGEAEAGRCGLGEVMESSAGSERSVVEEDTAARGGFEPSKGLPPMPVSKTVLRNSAISRSLLAESCEQVQKEMDLPRSTGSHARLDHADSHSVSEGRCVFERITR